MRVVVPLAVLIGPAQEKKAEIYQVSHGALMRFTMFPKLAQVARRVYARTEVAILLHFPPNLTAKSGVGGGHTLHPAVILP